MKQRRLHRVKPFQARSSKHCTAAFCQKTSHFCEVISKYEGDNLISPCRATGAQKPCSSQRDSARPHPGAGRLKRRQPLVTVHKWKVLAQTVDVFLRHTGAQEEILQHRPNKLSFRVAFSQLGQHCSHLQICSAFLRYIPKTNSFLLQPYQCCCNAAFRQGSVKILGIKFFNRQLETGRVSIDSRECNKRKMRLAENWLTTL